jgi:uridylate kinase
MPDMSKNDSERIVISVGGSLIIPKGGINTEFLSELNTFIRTQLAQTNRQFFLVIGGGATCRHYQKAAQAVIGHALPDEDVDWLGVHTTRLNAHLLRTIFYDIAHPRIIENYDHKIEHLTERLVIGAGWKPGWSTDYDAVKLCEDYAIRKIINMSNIDQVYTKDPKHFPDAQPIDRISWPDFRKIVGDEWKPGMNAPFDPIATQKAQELSVTVAVMGKDFANVERYINGESFLGTVIE